MTNASIDQATLNTLLDSIGGDREFLAELVETFKEDSPNQFAAMDQSLASGASEDFRRAAHSLKSNSASFGAMILSGQCKQLEDIGKSGDLSEAAPLLAAARAEYGRTVEELDAVLAGGEA